jgi:hypothetical protein
MRDDFVMFGLEVFFMYAELRRTKMSAKTKAKRVKEKRRKRAVSESLTFGAGCRKQLGVECKLPAAKLFPSFPLFDF